jgi:beta-phosphoglucomutase
MNTEPPLAVIFDMDGVLIDSVGLNWQAYNEVLSSQFGFSVSDNEIGNYVGRTLVEQVSMLNQHYNVDIDTDRFTQDTNVIKQRLFASIQPKPGVVSLLESLIEAGIPRAVGTSMSRDITKARLTTAGLWDYFNAVITEEDVQHHKPDPDVFLRAADKLHAAYTNCVVFEDAPAGVEAAKSGDMKCIAVVTPLVDRQKLADADRIVDSLDTVDVTLLRSLVSR